MKKNVMMRIASFLMVAVLLSTCAISGTFAKYVSSTTGTDEARVAKWDVKVNGTTANSNTFNFNLFNTIKDTDNSDETDLKYTDGTIIAPGTKGNFGIELVNDSEVTAKYSIVYSVTNTNNIPVEFSKDGTNWYTDITLLNVSDQPLAIGATVAAADVQWRWAYYVDAAHDTADTTLGLAGSAVLNVQAVVTVTQVD